MTTGIAFDVAAASIPRSCATSSIVVAPGVYDLLGRVEPTPGTPAARGTAAGDLQIRRVVAPLAQ